MEGVVKQARATRHPLLVACDANTDPMDFRRGLWFKEKCMFIETPEAGISNCQSTSPQGDLIEKTHDHVIACKSLQGKSVMWKSWKVSNQGRPRRLLFWWKKRGDSGSAVVEHAKSLARFQEW